jgi:mRNA-degrading endonuclease RelE of RelBE toxin-antitoxin system
LHSVVETPAFLNDSRSIKLSDVDRLIVSWIASNPPAGDPIEGTGGARKVRFPGKGKGKRGGYRIITFFTGPDTPVFLLNIFSKNLKTDLTAKERGLLKTVLANVAKAYRPKGNRK